MKKYLNLILIVVTILSMLSGMVLAWYANYQSNEADRYEANNKALLTKVKTYKDKNGLLVTESYELRFTIAELEISNDSTLRGMAKQVESMKIKLKNTQYINYINSKSTGSGSVPITLANEEIGFVGDSVNLYNEHNPIITRIASINDGFLKMDINLEKDSLVYDYTYRDSLIIVGHKHRRMCTKEGKKRFFIARWVNPDWQYKVSAKSMNPNTVINDIKAIHIETRKGLKR